MMVVVPGSNDRERCRQAKIPDEVVYRPKTEIALELYERALGNGLQFGWRELQAVPVPAVTICEEGKTKLGLLLALAKKTPSRLL